jgi:membrane-bound serine protease (ClpP class)
LVAAAPLAAATGDSAPAGTGEPQAAVLRTVEGPVVLIEVDGGINPATVEYIRDGLAVAAERGASALVIRMDTPGGLLESTKMIVKDLLGSDTVTVVYVAPGGAGATSAGVFITMAAHVAAMAPGTNIGAAHPVSGGGEDIEGDMRKKVENFAASLSKTIAQQRGRNAEWAESAVRESLSITEKEALEINVVDLVARDLTDLIAQLDGREVTLADGAPAILRTADAVVVEHEMNTRQKILNFIANPNLAYMLMALGMLGLYIEFYNPGLLFPGVVGLICLLLGLWATQVLPVNYTGLALLVVGLLLMTAEAFTPSFGVLGLGGLVAFVLGSLFLFETPDSTISVDRRLIAGIAGVIGTVVLLMGWLVVRAQRLQPASGVEGMVGEVGRVRRVVGDSGRAKVFVHGENWDAVVDGEAREGDQVEVIAVDGLTVRVRRVG